MLDAEITLAHNSRMITGPQIRAARALLDWTAAQLAERAKISYPTVQRAENAPGVPEMKTSNLLAVQNALESAGIVFIDPGETKPGGHGVRLKG